MLEKVALDELIQTVVGELERLGYMPSTINCLWRTWRRFIIYAKESGHENQYSEEIAIEYLEKRYEYPQSNKKFTGRTIEAVRALRFLGDYFCYGAFVRLRTNGTDPFIDVMDKSIINAYLLASKKRDNTDATIKVRAHHLKVFYDFLKFRKVITVADITPMLVSDYTISLQGGSMVYTKHRLATLRNYFRFLKNSKFVTMDYSYVIPSIIAPQHRNVPMLWTEENINILIGNIDRGNPAGKRDYAVICLVVYLGLRISDLANLKIEDIKWDKHEIQFYQHKTQNLIAYPMSQTIGWAIIDYIRYARPKAESNFLFLGINAPYCPMQSSAFGSLLDRSMRKLKIPKQTGHSCGFHSLRHALARRLLEQNTPLPTISQILGHTSIESSYPYLKIDINGLKECAISVNDKFLINGGIDND